MKKIDQEMFSALSSVAQSSERLRQNLNFHDSFDDPSQRMLVAIEPGSYVRPTPPSGGTETRSLPGTKGEIGAYGFQ